ncbi:response regulator [Pseudomethylobacillus aquaticus]|uniref:Virulence sensor protein BvgS n=1 Tax=Pseudomethylobacillus aquaticus TaxID=2676064 RepID=A0A3N0V033_9PROT|nr:ATP-binding protein [Pseudomethylobacillus aquaticus]ROH86166.1 response regulator [Pseudomethylobacillus aquaticus]
MNTVNERLDVDDQNAPQRIVKIRRDYNTWVANETLEDFALRFTPRSFRKWSIFRVSNTAFGAISFLVLEAIGGTIAINYGFINAFWAILAVSMIIFMTGLPISYYAAKFGLDMDLLTRGAGFGYIGSTISSFVYASFTFILFALEAAIMAYALELYFGMPLYIGYLVCALVVVPLVTHGVTLISRIQMITQPIWLTLMALPFIFILYKDPGVLDGLMGFAGKSGYDDGFNLYMFGTAMAIGMALIPQIGEQVDFLRFMPEKTASNRWRWHAGVLISGPGWIFLGMAKMLGGALLAYMAFTAGRSVEEAVNPNQMYLVGFSQVFSNTELVLAVTVFFVLLSQLKINMTNAYAGSLAWSNFFARLTHSHPGRVVWVVFNALIAIMLMELDVFQALEQVLGLYSNVAISWITAVVADLVINKPLGLSPKGIEFRRAYLYDINPVGVGAMAIASLLSVLAFIGTFGIEAQAFSAFIALITALVTSPLIAWYTRGKYYIARKPVSYQPGKRTDKCSICEREYEIDDIAYCPAYQGSICSLCCCLDARCNDACKPNARISRQWETAMKKILPRSLWRYLDSGMGHYLLLMAVTLSLLGAIFGLIYLHESLTLSEHASQLLPQLKLGYMKAFAALVLISGIIAWWLVLTSESRRVAQEESNRQTRLLQREITLHRQTDAELQQARLLAEQANQAKSRYITGISHELRTPLNSILGYAQLLDNDTSINDSRMQGIRVIRRSGEHLLSLIEGTLDIARIEGGKLTFDTRPLRFPEFIQQLVSMFELQARNKGITFNYILSGELPRVVRADHKRLSQILINILGNAVKFTRHGGVVFRVHYAREMMAIEVEDTGPGIRESELEQIFEPFSRGSAAEKIGGTGLGLTISKMLTELMGGELSLKSEVGKGTIFYIRLFLPQVRVEHDIESVTPLRPIGYKGPRRRILVVDNEPVDRELIINILQPLGFELAEAATGRDCLQMYTEFRPDLILMDLAMPVMDGWEASYMIRKVHESDVPIAIVSANAFDKGLENTADITAADFILKPVNVQELLRWLGDRLNISWISAADVAALTTPVTQAQTTMRYPARAHLDELMRLINLGYMRGIQKKLDELATLEPECGPFITRLRSMAQQFQLQAMQHVMEEVLSHD